ncbi:MAG: MBL fold metallo-hydrolase [Reichenbachiella sp.]
MKLTLSFILILGFFFAKSQSITYLGNEGVFIEYKGSKILIDALFDEYNFKFDAPSNSTMTKIMKGTAPFNGIDMVLATHAHRDHFKGQLAVDFLKANQSARLVAPPQALDSMKKFPDSFNKISSHIYSFPWKKGWKSVNQGEIQIQTTYMLHAGKRNFKVQNQVYMITIGGKKILHLGDTQMERDNFDNLRLEYEEFDAVIVPFWYLTNVYGAELVRKFMKSKKVIGMHFPKNPNEQPITKVRQQFPKAVTFTKVGQKTTF